MSPRARIGALALLLALALPAGAGAQAATDPFERADAPVAVLDVALYNAQANVQEPTDSAKAALATEVLAGKRGLNLRQVKALSERFRVPMEVFAA